MYIILSLLLLSIGVGHLLRKVRFVRKVEHGSRYTILILLFVFGVSIGSNRTLLGNIAHLGWYAVIIALLGVAGSIVAARLFLYIWKEKAGKGGGE